jgi:hypothetical protein
MRAPSADVDGSMLSADEADRTDEADERILGGGPPAFVCRPHPQENSIRLIRDIRSIRNELHTIGVLREAPAKCWTHADV